jgi:hypothetical protein
MLLPLLPTFRALHAGGNVMSQPGRVLACNKQQEHLTLRSFTTEDGLSRATPGLVERALAKTLQHLFSATCRC